MSVSIMYPGFNRDDITIYHIGKEQVCATITRMEDEKIPQPEWFPIEYTSEGEAYFTISGLKVPITLSIRF